MLVFRIKYISFFTLFFILVQLGYSQRLKKTKSLDNSRESDSIINRENTSNKNIKNKDAKIIDYLIVSHENDTTYVDTTLTIQKEYKFNYLRKDNLEVLPFSNLGQTYNSLSYQYRKNQTLPLFGARARHFNYMEIEDINYYHVPTPLTELFYKTAFEQGQLLDAFFTVNTSKQFNFSVAYKGLRSLGKYQHLLTSTGNFRFTTNYHTKNKRYSLRGHITMQDLFNEENGGLKDSNLPFFESGIEEFKDRSVLEVNFENADNILIGKRFHLDHQYNIIQKDTLKNHSLNIRHVISFEDKYYQYNQTQANDYFGEAFSSSNIMDKVTIENLYNQFELNYFNKELGQFTFNVNHTDFNYGYNKIVVLDESIIPNRLKGSVLGVGGSYKKKFNKLYLEGEFKINVSGDFEGNYLKGKAAYNVSEDISIGAQFNLNSRTPNYNKLLYQSDYINYNWKNNFNNIETQNIQFKLKAKNIVDITVDLSSINDYTYFTRNEDSLVKPFQSSNSISYIKIKAENEFKYKDFTLNNSVIYQNVSDEDLSLNVPQIITRNTLYYSKHLFKKSLYLQTGVTFNYFTEYYMNAYDPVLAEFYTQTEKKYGGFPRFDFFINAKVRQTRIFLKAEHFNSAWTGYNFYSAPNHPYRDFIVRFGLVWNFFL